MNRNALLGKALLEVLAEFAVFAALLFVSAGTLLWPAGWAFIAIFFSFVVAIVLWLARKEPELLAERMSSPMQRGQPLWDKVFVVAVVVLSFYIMFLTFRENAYLALVVKVQEERGHSVVSTGPYRYVRHPMYASMFLFFPGSALLLGSRWGLLLCVVLLGLLVWRIPLEERMLENGLAGYDEYARKVRYRLIPRVW